MLSLVRSSNLLVISLPLFLGYPSGGVRRGKGLGPHLCDKK